MSTIRGQNRRRRSHSASSALSSSSSHRIAKKVAAKRSYPDASSGQFGEQYRWDSDSFRRGKRRRRGLSAGSDGASASRISKANGFPQISVRPSRSSFAMSADEFGLPMSKGRKRERAQWSSTGSNSSFMDVSDPESQESLRRLRSNAFLELERSVEESGECLIQRMRELEYLRSGFLYEEERGRPLRPPGSPSATGPSPARQYPSSSEVSGDDDDDIQIYAGEPTSRSISPGVAMEADNVLQYDKPIFTTHHSFTSSPQSFGFLSAEEIPTHFSSSSPLSSSPPTSPLPEPIPNLPFTSHSANQGPATFASHPLPPPEATDKAVEALALALANGAGGLNDCVVGDDVGECDAGELWR